MSHFRHPLGEVAGEEIGQDVESLEREEEINEKRDNERSDT